MRDAKAWREGLDEVLRYPGRNTTALRDYVRHVSGQNTVLTDGAPQVVAEVARLAEARA